MALTLVNASCHCGLNAFQIPFFTETLPLASGMCHCNACRHTTGVLAVHTAPMVGAPLTEDSTVESQTVAELSSPKIKSYNATPEAEGKVTRYFCGTCSAHVLYSFKATLESTPSWMVSTGAMERVEGVVKVGYHRNVEFTRDGGLAEFYRVLDGVEVPRYAQEKTDGANLKLLPQGWKADSIQDAKEKKEYLELYCHCKTISLRITQATPEEAADPARWWAVAKKDENDINGRERHLCFHCLDTSCRKTSGALISSVILLDKAHIIDAHTGLPASFIEGTAGRPKGLVRYKSSQYVCREACGTCGAAVFFWNVDPSKTHLPKPDENGEPVLVDVYAGLVNQEDGGVRAEEWLAWYDTVLNVQDAIDRSGMEALVEGVKSASGN